MSVFLHIPVGTVSPTWFYSTIRLRTKEPAWERRHVLSDEGQPRKGPGQALAVPEFTEASALTPGEGVLEPLGTRGCRARGPVCAWAQGGHTCAGLSFSADKLPAEEGTARSPGQAQAQGSQRSEK